MIKITLKKKGCAHFVGLCNKDMQLGFQKEHGPVSCNPTPTAYPLNPPVPRIYNKAPHCTDSQEIAPRSEIIKIAITFLFFLSLSFAFLTHFQKTGKSLLFFNTLYPAAPRRIPQYVFVISRAHRDKKYKRNKRRKTWFTYIKSNVFFVSVRDFL